MDLEPETSYLEEPAPIVKSTEPLNTDDSDIEVVPSAEDNSLPTKVKEAIAGYEKETEALRNTLEAANLPEPVPIEIIKEPELAPDEVEREPEPVQQMEVPKKPQLKITRIQMKGVAI